MDTDTNTSSIFTEMVELGNPPPADPRCRAVLDAAVGMNFSPRYKGAVAYMVQKVAVPP